MLSKMFFKVLMASSFSSSASMLLRLSAEPPRNQGSRANTTGVSCRWCWYVLCGTTVALSVYNCTPPDYNTHKTASIQRPLVNSDQGGWRCHISRQARNSEARIENTAPPIIRCRAQPLITCERPRELIASCCREFSAKARACVAQLFLMPPLPVHC
jgi:hypothetical protein